MQAHSYTSGNDICAAATDATVFMNGTVSLAAGFWNLTVVYQQGKGYAGLILQVYNSSSTSAQVCSHCLNQC